MFGSPTTVTITRPAFTAPSIPERARDVSARHSNTRRPVASGAERNHLDNNDNQDDAGHELASPTRQLVPGAIRKPAAGGNRAAGMVGLMTRRRRVTSMTIMEKRR